MNKENTPCTESQEIKITHIKIKPSTCLKPEARLYLAVAHKQISDRLIRVYTFGCPGNNHDCYCVRPSTDVATFKTVAGAQSYTDKVQRIMQTQSQWPIFAIARQQLQTELAQFNEKIK